MSEESKPKALPPPTDAERALAIKLGRALGRHPTGATALGRNPTGALGRSPTGANPAIASRKVTGSTTAATPLPAAPSAAPESPREKQAILAARRASVQPSDERAVRTSRRPATAARPARKSIIALGLLLLLAGLAAGGVYVKQLLDARSPAGRVRNELLSWELAGAPLEREQAYGNLDNGAPSTVVSVIELLTDASRVERGDSNSQRAMQIVAHHYLMHYAARVKAAPPKEAADLAKKIFEGAPVTPDAWTAARDGWRAWLVEQQGKGSVPKS